MTITVLLPQGVLSVTVNSPLVLSLDLIVIAAVPPELTVTELGVMVRFYGPVAVTVPLPLAIVTTIVAEPPFLPIETLFGVPTGAH